MISILPLLCVLVPGAPPGTAGPGRPPGRRGAPLQQRHQQSQLRPTRFHLSVHPSAVNGETTPSVITGYSTLFLLADLKPREKQSKVSSLCSVVSPKELAEFFQSQEFRFQC